MKRRGFIRTVAGGIAAASVAPLLRAGSIQGADRPNLLWLITEDNTCTFNEPYGDRCGHTPNLQRLAADGIVFENSHSTAPVCSPSRSTLLTGRHPGSMGTQHMRSARPLPPGVRFFPEYLREAGYFCTNHVKTDYNTSSSYQPAWDLCGDGADWRKRPSGQPFFAVFSFMESHESRLFTRAPLNVDPRQVRVPAYLPDNEETRADLAQEFDNVARADVGIGEVLKRLEEDRLFENTIVFYFSDHGGCLPRSKRYVYENGTHTPLVLRVPKKFQHLAPSPPGTRVRDLISYVDLAPTVLSLAGLPLSSQFQGRAFAGPLKTSAPHRIFSTRGRMDERYDFSAVVRDGRFRYIRNYLCHRPAGQHISFLWNEASMKRWQELYRQQRLNQIQSAFFEPRAAEELFDCDADPDNVSSLAGNPRYTNLLEDLREANRVHLLEIRETGFWPEAMMVEESSGASPTIPSSDDSRYPLERILKLVDEIQLGRLPSSEISRAMNDPNPALRYWSVTAALAREDSPDATLLLNDRSPSVRVSAAESVLRRSDHPAAWRRLFESLSPDSRRELTLAALNSLTYLGRPPEFIRQRVRELAAPVMNETLPPPLEPGGEGGAPFTPTQWAEMNWSGYLPHAALHLVERGLC